MKCKYCGGKVSFFADYCPSCGKKTFEDTKKACVYCGKQIDKNSRFCPKCGKDLILTLASDTIDININARKD